MTSIAATVSPRSDRQAFVRLLLAACLAACVISLVIHWQAIINFDMGDPDDRLRLVQVRDWIAGQSWRDVSQHRFNPPFGGDMHWSRIVDIPLAAGILLLTPLLGTHLAETVTATLVPLLLLIVTMSALAYAVRPVLGTRGAALTAVLVMLMPSLIHQMGPMRIDHHGWQIAMAAICLAALVGAAGRKSGMAAGLAGSLWVHVSAEALPYLAAIGALLGVRYLLAEEERPRFLAYLLTLAGASLLLFVLTQPAAEWLVPKCDALSTPFLLAFVAAAGIAGAGALLPLPSTLAVRAAILGVAGAGATAGLVAAGLGCAGGPFGNLDPLVYDFWYLSVPEGLPIWMQPAATAVGMIWTPLVGMVGTWLAWRAASERQQSWRWATVGLLLVAALAVAMLVHRAQAVAHLYALPGCGFLLLKLLPRARALPSAAARILLTVGVILLPWPVPAIFAAVQVAGEPETWEQPSSANSMADRAAPRVRCASSAGMAELNKLQPALILAPIDIGPAILVATPHSIMAAGYHRNDLAMKNVILAFRAKPDEARKFIEQRRIGIIAYCPGLPEVERYRLETPQGLMAHLERNETPSWLVRVPVSGASDLRVWRVKEPR